MSEALQPIHFKAPSIRNRHFPGELALTLILLCLGLLRGAEPESRPRFLYEEGPLVMTEDALRDANGSFTLAQLPAPDPKCKEALKGDVTPLTARMWKIALDDVSATW